MLHNVVPGGLLAGPPGHDVHHRLTKFNFAKFFTWWDRLGGTFRQGQASPGMVALAAPGSVQ
jgi:sterol desaturase/sphingolipid hydroxylase (fatty acid hydroxylase superfamily)